MENNKPPSLRRIARLAGVSTTAASFALNNQPGVSDATRVRILAIARERGYSPDARMNSWMAQVRGTKSKELLPIVWLNFEIEENAWRRRLYLTPLLEGARLRAVELGYRLEEIWSREPGLTMKRLSSILVHRGIEGVIVTFPAKHLRLDWERFASVSLGSSLLAPALHRISSDLNFNLLLALKALRRLGYRRIGICLAHEVDSASHYAIRATAHELHHRTPMSVRVPPLFHSFKEKCPGELESIVTRWLGQFRPDVVVCHDNRLEKWITAAGFRVPDEVGVVHLATDDDVSDWAGIHSRRREIGATVVEQLVSQMRNHQFGVPATPLDIMIRGTWQTGRTLRATPRPASEA